MQNSEKNSRGISIFELSFFLLILGISIFWGVNSKKKLAAELYNSRNSLSVDVVKQRLQLFGTKTGSYPSTEQYNSEAWRTENLIELISEDIDYFKDYKTKELFGYTAEPEGCTGKKENPCYRFQLLANQQNGDKYTVTEFLEGSEIQSIIDAAKANQKAFEEADNK